MKLQEAIDHAEAKGRGKSRCAEEHRQLARWLRELLQRRKAERAQVKMTRMLANAMGMGDA